MIRSAFRSRIPVVELPPLLPTRLVVPATGDIPAETVDDLQAIVATGVQLSHGLRRRITEQDIERDEGVRNGDS